MFLRSQSVQSQMKKKVRGMSMIIEVPDWCVLGKTIEWHAPEITGNEWVRDKIIAFGYDGFFHQEYNCPIYFTRFDEYGKTIREIRK